MQEVQGQFYLGEEVVPELEQAVPVNCGEGNNKMLLESCNRAFGDVDPVSVGWDKVDLHLVSLNVCFDGLGALIVHYVERECKPLGVEVGKNVCERCNHGTIVFGRHGMDKDGIQVVNECHKHILHIAGGLHWEGTGAVGVHCPSV